MKSDTARPFGLKVSLPKSSSTLVPTEAEIRALHANSQCGHGSSMCVCETPVGQVKQRMDPPAPDPKFWDRIAPGYAKKPVPDEEAYRQTLERAALHLKPEFRVLEIGSGTGTTALKLAPHARNVLATDLSPGMIGIAREKVRAEKVENVQFEVGTLEAPFLDERSYDAVLAFNLFHLLGDIPAAIRRVRDLLQPGGFFISKTPCIGEDGLLVRSLIPILRAVGKAPFVNIVKKEALEQEVAEAGFEILETASYPSRSHNFFIVARKPSMEIP